jgi:alcohol dehydrogenase class IV
MDALTQLLEAYVSSKSSPMTDALAYSGMKYMSESILQACSEGASDVNIRAKMAYGSLISGITLANAGLGIIHGLASPIGGYFNIPHGVVCGTLLAEATKLNIEMLQNLGSEGFLGLRKHAEIGALLLGDYHAPDEKVPEYNMKLVETLEKWTIDLKINRLGKFGITEDDIDRIVEKAGLKNNPVNLSKENIKTIIMNRL